MMNKRFLSELYESIIKSALECQLNFITLIVVYVLFLLHSKELSFCNGN